MNFIVEWLIREYETTAVATGSQGLANFVEGLAGSSPAVSPPARRNHNFVSGDLGHGWTPVGPTMRTRGWAGAMAGKDDLKLALRFLRSIDTSDPKLNAELEILIRRLETLLNRMDDGQSNGTGHDTDS